MTEFEMPPEVESPEFCAAWIAYHVGTADHEPLWLTKGRLQRDLLPWRRELAAFGARPQCTVGREWVRLALKTLGAEVASVSDEAPVLIDFKDGVLSILGVGDAIVMPAKGTSWPGQITIPAGRLRHLPKRLMSDPVCISIWDSCLIIEKWRYFGSEHIGETSLAIKTSNG